MSITDGKRERYNYSTFNYDTSPGRNSMRRIYDRLRKASYRKMKAFTSLHWDATWDKEEWDMGEHMAYVQGVKDALNAIEVLGARTYE